MVGKGRAASWVLALALTGVASCTGEGVRERVETTTRPLNGGPPLTIGLGTTLASGAELYGPPAVATDGDGFLVAWAEIVPVVVGNPGGRVLAAKVDAHGTLTAPAVVLFESTEYLGAIAGVTFAGGHYVVSWTTFVSDLPEGLIPYATVEATLDTDGHATLGSTTLQAADRIDSGPRHDVLVSNGSIVLGLAANNDFDYLLSITGATFSPGAAPVAVTRSGPLLACEQCSASPFPEVCDRECTQLQAAHTGKRFVVATDSGEPGNLANYRKKVDVKSFESLVPGAQSYRELSSPFRRCDPNEACHDSLGFHDPTPGLAMASGKTSTVLIHTAGVLELNPNGEPSSWEEARLKSFGHAILVFDQDGEVNSDSYETDLHSIEDGALTFADGYFLALDKICQKELGDAGFAWMLEGATPGFQYVEPAATCVDTPLFGRRPAFVSNGHGQLLAAYNRGDIELEIRAFELSSTTDPGGGGAGAGGAAGEAGAAAVMGGAAGEATTAGVAGGSTPTTAGTASGGTTSAGGPTSGGATSAAGNANGGNATGDGASAGDAGAPPLSGSAGSGGHRKHDDSGCAVTRGALPTNTSPLSWLVALTALTRRTGRARFARRGKRRVLR